MQKRITVEVFLCSLYWFSTSFSFKMSWNQNHWTYLFIPAMPIFAEWIRIFSCWNGVIKRFIGLKEPTNSKTTLTNYTKVFSEKTLNYLTIRLSPKIRFVENPFYHCISADRDYTNIFLYYSQFLTCSFFSIKHSPKKGD